MHRLIRKFNDPLYKNSIFLIASSLLGAGTGFVFWVIATRFYSAEDVGLASAMVSSVSLISMSSLIGLDFGIIRYIHVKDKNEIINSCITTVAIISIILALIFLSIVDYVSPSLRILKVVWVSILFVLFAFSDSLANILRQGVFVGLRNTKYSFIQTLATLPRIFLLPFLVAFGAFGIFACFVSTAFLAVIIGFIMVYKAYSAYRFTISIDKCLINDIIHFSFSNYVARIFEALPNFVLPIMVVNVLGIRINAYFYIAWAISTLILAIPRFTSMALFAEGSYNEKELRENAFKSLKFIGILLTLAIAGVYIFGYHILLIFGKEYSKNSFELLKVLVLGALPFSINSVYAAVKRVKKDIKTVIRIYGCIATLTLIMSYILMQQFGLIGVGYAWILGNLIVTCWIVGNLFS